MLGNVTGTLSILQTLTAQTTFGVDYSGSVRQTYVPARQRDRRAQYNGYARQAETNLQNLNFQQLLTYNPSFAQKHELDVVGGYEYSSFNNYGFAVEAQNFVSDAFTWNSLASGVAGAAPPPRLVR